MSIGDSVLQIDDLFHSQRTLQGPEFSEIASANRLILSRKTNRRFICNGCFDRQNASQYQQRQDGVVMGLLLIRPSQ